MRLIRPRGVVIPSLAGGWLEFVPSFRSANPGELRPSRIFGGLASRYEPGHFVGFVIATDGRESYGFPVIWGRETQLQLVYFFELPNRMTHVFPQDLHLHLAEGEVEIEGAVTIDSERGPFARQAAELQITLRSPVAREPQQFALRMVIPATVCARASESLADLFPAVTAADLDSS